MFQMLDSSNKNIQSHAKIPQSVGPSPWQYGWPELSE